MWGAGYQPASLPFLPNPTLPPHPGAGVISPVSGSADGGADNGTHSNESRAAVRHDNLTAAFLFLCGVLDVSTQGAESSSAAPVMNWSKGETFRWFSVPSVARISILRV